MGAKPAVAVLLNLYGFIYFKNALPTVSLGSAECVVCASCTVPIMGWLRKPGRNSGVCCGFLPMGTHSIIIWETQSQQEPEGEC